MPVIEGVGDEVFQVLMVALVVILGIVGWWSTSISEQPLIRTVLILEPRHHTAAENTTTTTTPSPPQDTGQNTSSSSTAARTEAVAAPDTSSSASKNESQASQSSSEQQPEAAGQADPGAGASKPEGSSSSPVPAIPNVNEASQEASGNAEIEEAFTDTSSPTNELRRRRLQFFSDIQVADETVNSCSSRPPESTSSMDVHIGDDSAETSSSISGHQETDTDQQGSQTESESAPSDPCQACDDIRIKLKFLNDNHKTVQGKLQEPLGDFKRRNFAVEIAARKVIRLIFNGQVLQSDERTLQNYGLFDNCVVHCLVHNQRTTNPNVENATTNNSGEDLHFGGIDAGDTREWDMSNVMYISMFVILSAIWYLRINFSQLFSATSTVALFGLSGIFVIFLVGMYIPDQEVIRT
ncbi:hypothetical protein ONE63_003938 [Megalurothrips usitatus]|uniref:Ubiquitin-like domain-containing protein n=1 Tax=Megalurothrips usitatus TaxID=439358 RepID=A0AAV7X760_9NEOP|nr:hypothetical protein ONE63_003938 [Megalurothrips usitatus]